VPLTRVVSKKDKLAHQEMTNPMPMRLISINVGLPRKVAWKDRTVLTGIFKDPVTGRVRVRRHNLDGDGQADRSVHGGLSKAVYLYPSEHYTAWSREFPGLDPTWGAFGENFTTEGIVEAAMQIGDKLCIGTAVVRVTEPRMPCYKLGMRLGRDDILERFLASGRTGIYLAVEQEGEVEAGDGFTLHTRAGHGLTIADVVRVFAREKDDVDTIRRLALLPELSDSWRDYFHKQLHNPR
jgi:MOSC domain-containing protein YiiM